MKKTKRLLLAALMVPALSATVLAETVNFACDIVKTIDFKGEKREFKDKFTYAVETEKKKVTDGYGYVYDLKELSGKTLSFVTVPDKTKWFSQYDINRKTGAFSVSAYDQMGKKAASNIVYGGTCKTTP